MRRKILCWLIITALAASLLSGCWNRREPEFLAFVVAVAFDFNEETDMYQIYAQIANAQAMGVGAEGGPENGGETEFKVAATSGITPFEAMRNLGMNVTRELFWAHSRILLISERLARRGIGDIMDLFERERQLRLINRPLVVAGDILTLMETPFPLEQTGGVAIDRLLISIRQEHAVIPDQFLSQLYSVYAAPGREMFLGRIEVMDGGEEDDGEEAQNSERPAVRIGGAALFRGDRMVGWATAEETGGWLYATTSVPRGTLVIECPEREGKYISIEVFKSSFKMIPAGSMEQPRVWLEIKARGRIQEFQSTGDLDRESEYTRSLEKRSAQVIRNRVEEMFARSQELRSDIFGFGNLFYRRQNEQWNRMAEDWYHFYPRLVLDLDVRLDIKRVGLVTDPL